MTIPTNPNPNPNPGPNAPTAAQQQAAAAAGAQAGAATGAAAGAAAGAGTARGAGRRIPSAAAATAATVDTEETLQAIHVPPGSRFFAYAIVVLIVLGLVFALYDAVAAWWTGPDVDVVTQKARVTSQATVEKVPDTRDAVYIEKMYYGGASNRISIKSGPNAEALLRRVLDDGKALNAPVPGTNKRLTNLEKTTTQHAAAIGAYGKRLDADDQRDAFQQRQIDGKMDSKRVGDLYYALTRQRQQAQARPPQPVQYVPYGQPCR